MIADAGEDVENLPLFRLGILRALRCQQRQAEAARQRDGRLVARFLLAVVVPLQLDVNIFATINRDEQFERASRFGHSAVGQRMRQRTFVAAGDADEAVGEFGEIGKRSYGLRLQDEFVGNLAALGQRCRIFRCAQLGASDKAAQVLISNARGAEQGNAW